VTEVQTCALPIYKRPWGDDVEEDIYRVRSDVVSNERSGNPTVG